MSKKVYAILGKSGEYMGWTPFGGVMEEVLATRKGATAELVKVDKKDLDKNKEFMIVSDFMQGNFTTEEEYDALLETDIISHLMAVCNHVNINSVTMEPLKYLRGSMEPIHRALFIMRAVVYAASYGPADHYIDTDKDNDGEYINRTLDKYYSIMDKNMVNDRREGFPFGINLFEFVKELRGFI